MSILIKIKNVYGRELIYPIDAAAETFARLTGKKTLDRSDLELIKQLGFEIKIKEVTL